MNIDLPDVCTPKEIARAIKALTERDIKEDCRAGRITHYRRNSKIFILRKDVYEYLEGMACQRKTQDTDFNGEPREMSGKSSGMNRVNVNGSQRALDTAKRLIKSSKATSKDHNVVQFQG